MPITRDYASLLSRLTVQQDRDSAMHAAVDGLWDAFNAHAFSWVGFYIDDPDQPDDRRLILGPHRDRPACSPIGLHGVCGSALLRKAPVIVDDVATLGANYIACDPRDRSEIVLPLFDEAGSCWGVLDVDSEQVGAFSKADEAGLLQVLRAVGL